LFVCVFVLGKCNDEPMCLIDIYCLAFLVWK